MRQGTIAEVHPLMGCDGLAYEIPDYYRYVIRFDDGTTAIFDESIHADLIGFDRDYVGLTGRRVSVRTRSFWERLSLPLPKPKFVITAI